MVKYSGLYDIMNISFRKKILAVIVICLMMLMSLPLVMGANHNQSGPVLNIEILSGPHFPSPAFRVKNIGDETAHNIKLTDIIVNGSILYNNRDMKIADEMEPSDWVISRSNSFFIGFVVFSMVITVFCDENVFYSDETNGFIIGPFLFIP